MLAKKKYKLVFLRTLSTDTIRPYLYKNIRKQHANRSNNNHLIAINSIKCAQVSKTQCTAVRIRAKCAVKRELVFAHALIYLRIFLRVCIITNKIVKCELEF